MSGIDIILQKRKQLLFPLFVLFIVNFYWASSLELYADEAYYFLFSEKPDWGYFDHPPVVAWLIRLGTFLFGGELGVRFVFVLLISLSYGLVYVLAKPENPRTFWLITLGLFPYHLMGFMALPDVPLLFFTLLFFLGYKRYLDSESFINIFLVAVFAAAMIYSKYHGVLILLFTVLSNLQLLKKRSFYYALGIFSLLMVPHVIWLVQHDFISITYHLFNRESSGFSWNNVGNYFVSFFLFNGPFLFFPLFFLAHKHKPDTLFKKALRYNLKGFFAFFLLMSFKGRVEANWTSVIVFPTVILAINYLNVRYAKILGMASIVLILLFRVYLLYPQDGSSRAYEFHGHNSFAEEIKAKSSGFPIAANRYQEAALLSFYLDEFIPALNINSRKNQFEIWETGLNDGDTIMFIERNPEGDISHPYFGNYALKKQVYHSSSSTSSISITTP